MERIQHDGGNSNGQGPTGNSDMNTGVMATLDNLSKGKKWLGMGTQNNSTVPNQNQSIGPATIASSNPFALTHNQPSNSNNTNNNSNQKAP